MYSPGEFQGPVNIRWEFLQTLEPPKVTDRRSGWYLESGKRRGRGKEHKGRHLTQGAVKEQRWTTETTSELDGPLGSLERNL